MAYYKDMITQGDFNVYYAILNMGNVMENEWEFKFWNFSLRG